MGHENNVAFVEYLIYEIARGVTARVVSFNQPSISLNILIRTFVGVKTDGCSINKFTFRS